MRGWGFQDEVLSAREQGGDSPQDARPKEDRGISIPTSLPEL